MNESETSLVDVCLCLGVTVGCTLIKELIADGGSIEQVKQLISLMCGASTRRVEACDPTLLAGLLVAVRQLNLEFGITQSISEN